MLPFIVAGGIMTALAFAVGGIHATEQHGTFAAYLIQIGSTAFSLYVGVLAAFIAYSIADRPGLAPGFIGGILAAYWRLPSARAFWEASSPASSPVI
jgi:PTS system fructose-specific IIC component